MSAATQTSAGWISAEDLERMPEDERYELVKGDLRPMPPPPGGSHGSTTMNLSALATNHVLLNDLGICFVAETGFKIASDPDTVIAPDWAFVAKGRLPEPLPPGYPPLVPDIVLETRSPSTTAREAADRIAQWLDAGAQIVWDLDPQRHTLAVYRSGTAPYTLRVGDLLTGEDVLPGFSVEVGRLFPGG